MVEEDHGPAKYFDPMFIIGSWSDNLGHRITVEPADAGHNKGGSRLAFWVLMEKDGLPDKHFTVSKDRARKEWMCGNGTLVREKSDDQTIVWHASDGRESMWMRLPPDGPVYFDPPDETSQEVDAQEPSGEEQVCPVHDNHENHDVSHPSQEDSGPPQRMYSGYDPEWSGQEWTAWSGATPAELVGWGDNPELVGWSDNYADVTQHGQSFSFHAANCWQVATQPDACWWSDQAWTQWGCGTTTEEENSTNCVGISSEVADNGNASWKNWVEKPRPPAQPAVEVATPDDNIVDWTLGEPWSSLVRFPKDFCITSPIFKVATSANVQLVFYPNGRNNAQDGHCTVALMATLGKVNIMFELHVNDHRSGFKVCHGRSYRVDLPKPFGEPTKTVQKVIVTMVIKMFGFTDGDS